MKINLKILNIALIVLITIGIVNIARLTLTGYAVNPVSNSNGDVMLFVMSFCPFGQQAEKAMKPVVDLLGDKVTIEPHFIVTVNGNNVQSLHGLNEAKEDMRQACIWKYYGQKTFWNYVDYVNNKCSLSNIETCWKDAAASVNIDISKIENCATNEGINLMSAEQALTEKYGVTGSPTLIIAGKEYNGPRTPEAYKNAICEILNPKPSECSQTLSSTGSQVSGGCGS